MKFLFSAWNKQTLYKMTDLERDIDYKFDCRRVAILEKIYLKKYKGNISSYLWGVLSHTLTTEYMSRHPEKPWDHSCHSCGCTGSIDKIIDEKTLAEIEDQIKKMNETDKVPICECDECDDIFITHRNNWIKFSTNPNVSLELIEKYWDKEWNVYCLAKNQMTGAKARYKKEYLAALKIQEMFLQAKYNPDYAYCRRLHSEFYQSLCL